MTSLFSNLPPSLAAISVFAAALDRGRRGASRNNTSNRAPLALVPRNTKRGPLPFTNEDAIHGVVYCATETVGNGRSATARQFISISIALSGASVTATGKQLTYGDVSDFLGSNDERSLLSAAALDAREWVREAASSLKARVQVGPDEEAEFFAYALDEARAAVTALRRRDVVTPDAKRHQRMPRRGLRVIATDRRKGTR